MAILDNEPLRRLIESGTPVSQSFMKDFYERATDGNCGNCDKTNTKVIMAMLSKEPLIMRRMCLECFSKKIII